MLKVLVADDDSGLRLSVRSALQNTGQYAVTEAIDGADALAKVEAQPFQLVILDVDMPRLRGLEALRLIKEHDPSIVVIVLTAYASLPDAVQAVKEGAYDYLSKPVRGDDLLQLVDRALQAQKLISRVAASSPIMTEAGRQILGSTLEMQKVFNIINKLSKVETPVLIRGPSGTGKELVARAIHYNSMRKDHPFVAINCSAIPDNLFESELFGHEKGAFTGADQRRIGKFQHAEGGTLFLDEVGDLPPALQVKFLRVLQEKLFTPVGSNREIQSRVRVIAATNRPLEEMIAKGTFRDDLFYRLNVIPIFLPALADRKNDIEHLVHGFIRKFNQQHNRKVTGLTAEAMNCLKRYNWPGNIRELENVIEHAFILESANQLTLASLPEPMLESTGMKALLDSQQNNKRTAAQGPATTAEHTQRLRAAGFLSGNSTENDADDGNSTNFDAENGDAESLMQNSNAWQEDSSETTDDDITTPVKSAGGPMDYHQGKEQFEREFIIKALKTFKGRINQTALHAGIPKKTLLRKIEKYGLNAKDFAE